MKKLMSLLLITTLVIMTAGCGGQGSSNLPSSQSGENASSAAAGGKETIVGAIVVKAVGIDWFDCMGWETDKWGEKLEGYQLKNHILGPTTIDPAAQLQSLSDAIALTPDFLVVVPTAADAVDAQLAMARANGTIVISHEGSTLKNIDYNVDAFDNTAYGEHFADLFVKYGGESGKIALTVGSLTEVSHNQWAQAIYDKLKRDHPGWESVTGENFIEGGSTDTAYEVTKQLIQKYPDLTAIFIGGTSSVLGVSRAVEELGKTGEIILIGNSPALSRAEAWEAGSLTHTCFWYPGHSAAAAYEIALRKMKGEEIKTGDNLGIFGFENIVVDGTSVYGSGWFDVTPENWKDMIL